jgi:hypothetical protein
MRHELADLLPYVHPLWQAIALLLMVVTLSLGLRLRRVRMLPGDPSPQAALLRRHIVFGIVFLAAVTSGYGLGLLTMAFVRERPVFRTAHGYFGTIVLGLFWLGAWYGVRLSRGGPTAAKDVSNHAFFVILAAILALAVAVMGYALLP